jgi:hypothetical protein
MLKDRTPVTFNHPGKSYLRFRIFTRYNSLPLAIHITSAVSSWEVFIGFTHWPTSDSFVLKSVLTPVTIGSNFQTSIHGDWGIRGLLYSHLKGEYTLRAEYLPKECPKADFSAYDLSRLKRMDSFLNLTILQGRRREPTQQSREGSKVDTREGSTLSVGMFYLCKKGQAERVKEHAIATEKKIQEVRERKLCIDVERKHERLAEFHKRMQKMPRRKVFMLVMLSKVLTLARAHAWNRIICYLLVIEKVWNAIYRARYMDMLNYATRVMLQMARIKIAFNRRTLPKQVSSIVHVSYSFKMMHSLKIMNSAKKEAREVVSKVLNKIHFIIFWRESLNTTASVIDKIASRLRRQSQLSKVFYLQLKEALLKIIECVVPVDHDAEFSTQKLKTLCMQSLPEIFSIIYQLKMSDYLRSRIDKVLKDAPARKKLRQAAGLKYDKDGLDWLIRIKNFPTTEKKVRSSYLYPMYEEIVKNQKIAQTAKFWAYHNPSASRYHYPQLARKDTMSMDGSQKDPADTPSNTFLTNTSSLSKKSNSPPRILKKSLTLQIEEDVQNGQSKVSDVEKLKNIMKRIKGLFAFQPFKIDLSEQFLASIIYSIWKQYKSKGVVQHQTTHHRKSTSIRPSNHS